MPETQETCTFCGSIVIARKLDDEDLFIFPDHDECGPFNAPRSQLLRLRMKGVDAERARLASVIRAHKAKGKKPPTI